MDSGSGVGRDVGGVHSVGGVAESPHRTTYQIVVEYVSYWGGTGTTNSRIGSSECVHCTDKPTV